MAKSKLTKAKEIYDNKRGNLAVSVGSGALGEIYKEFITKEKVKEQLENHDDQNQRLIMEHDGIAIGEMCYTHLGDSVDIGIKICNFDYQNQGHGRIFLSMLIERLFQKGYQKIVLDTMVENKTKE